MDRAKGQMDRGRGGRWTGLRANGQGQGWQMDRAKRQMDRARGQRLRGRG